MTAKRFTYEYDEYNGNLFDNKMNTFYHIEDNDENIEVLCDRLNWLVEENEQLKEALKELKEIGDYQAKRINELNDENEQLRKQLDSEHQMLDNAILLERTRMGQSALKQYKEAIQ